MNFCFSDDRRHSLGRGAGDQVTDAENLSRIPGRLRDAATKAQQAVEALSSSPEVMNSREGSKDWSAVLPRAGVWD